VGLSIDPDLTGTGAPWTPPLVGSQYAQIGACGRSFGRGLFRFHDGTSGPVAQDLVHEAFPDLAGHADVLAFDWLGRQFAVTDAAGATGGEPEAVILDPAAMSREGIVASDQFLRAFQSPVMLEALHADLFERWRASVGCTGLDFDRCVGLKVPLFLSGTLTLDNLEESDLSVYWSICTQLWQQAKDLPAGTAIREVRFESR
jgi:hypothetical protein